MYYSLLNLQIVSYVGAVLVIAGDLARKVAIITAAENFDHLVQSEKADNHKVRVRTLLSFKLSFCLSKFLDIMSLKLIALSQSLSVL